MKSIKLMLVALTGAISLASLFTFESARASVVYTWSGTCTSSCVGTATATLTLIDSYIPGTALSNAVFQSFSYTSSNGLFTLPPSQGFDFIQGTLPASSGTAPQSVSIFTRLSAGPLFSYSFGSTTPGLWSVLCETIIASCTIPTVNGLGDFGTDGTFSISSATPLPTTLPLFASGLGALGLLGWRKRRKAH